MKTKSFKKAAIGILTVILLMGISIQVYSYANGVAGRTLKVLPAVPVIKML